VYEVEGEAMARIVIIGGSGHVGTYLVPALVERGHQVINVSRGTSVPYRPHPAWKAVELVVADRTAEEARGSFGSRIAALAADIVIDMLSFELDGARQLVEVLRGKGRALSVLQLDLGLWTRRLGAIHGGRRSRCDRRLRRQQGEDRGLAPTVILAVRAVEARPLERRRRGVVGTRHAQLLRLHREEPPAPRLRAAVLQRQTD
jgi:NAD(P)-dependent dehydrogenase (short-subunit alcohol dehydrogenase family)